MRPLVGSTQAPWNRTTFGWRTWRRILISFEMEAKSEAVLRSLRCLRVFTATAEPCNQLPNTRPKEPSPSTLASSRFKSRALKSQCSCWPSTLTFSRASLVVTLFSCCSAMSGSCLRLTSTCSNTRPVPVVSGMDCGTDCTGDIVDLMSSIKMGRGDPASRAAWLCSSSALCSLRMLTSWKVSMPCCSLATRRPTRKAGTVLAWPVVLTSRLATMKSSTGIFWPFEVKRVVGNWAGSILALARQSFNRCCSSSGSAAPKYSPTRLRPNIWCKRRSAWSTKALSSESQTTASQSMSMMDSMSFFSAAKAPCALKIKCMRLEASHAMPNHMRAMLEFVRCILK
mmetsp:Transcript_36845/g.83723  ORF Transcript_36845/g.83723 Transcript_36845/m.83723 type:complete len:341 (+) Transcript_36845:666-1688(+)